jgi:hypothetical protein
MGHAVVMQAGNSRDVWEVTRTENCFASLRDIAVVFALYPCRVVTSMRNLHIETVSCQEKY